MSNGSGGSGMGWGVFSGLALIMIGTGDLLRGLNFSSYDPVKLADMFGIQNPDIWAWVFLVVGVIVVAAGFGTFTRRPWAQKAGIAGVLLAALINAFFFLSPIESAAGIGFAVDMFVLYALTVKWD